MKNSMPTHDDGTRLPDLAAMSDGAFSTVGEQGPEARTPRGRTRERLLLLKARRTAVYHTLAAFGLSTRHVRSYRTERLQELRGKAEKDLWITVLWHRRTGCRTTVSARSVLDLVLALEHLDAEIAEAREWLRHAPWP